MNMAVYIQSYYEYICSLKKSMRKKYKVNKVNNYKEQVKSKHMSAL